MQWPSKNVSQGGIFHTAKATYSPETKNFLNLLMEETKMSMRQRKSIDYYLRNGEPLPVRKPSYPKSVPKVVIRPCSASRRRSQDAIIKSGAYKRDEFVPFYPRIDREKEKQKLQDRMAYNSEVPSGNVRKTEDKNEKSNHKLSRFDELMQEIKDREEWLKEMEELGEGAKYRLMIKQQIQEKFNEIEKLKVINEPQKNK